MTKRIKFVDGKPTIVDEMATYIPFPNIDICLDVVEHIKIGNCLCCGMDEYIGVSGNLIMIYCNGKKDEFHKCDHRGRHGCPGTSYCPRSHEFEPGRDGKAVTMIETIIGLLLELGPVVINNHGYIRHIIAKWITDEMYSVGSYIHNEGEDNNTKYYVIKLNDAILKARDELTAKSTGKVTIKPIDMEYT